MQHVRSALGVLLALVLTGCRSSPSPGTPHIPPGDAGAILSRALTAAGGWDRWAALHDLGYVSTLTLRDPFGEVTSESIGWYMAPLHAGMHARMESIGLATDVTLGASPSATWMLRDGQPVTDPQRLALTRFNLVSNLFWFALPFAVAELPCTVTTLGDVEGAHAVRWQRLKVVFEARDPAVPGEWFVLYFNNTSGLIDRVYARISAPFLRHTLWLGEWIDYRDWNGLKKERQRKFYPADDSGSIVGAVVAEQLVEHVQFNNGYTAEQFAPPAAASAAAASGGHGAAL